jgi:hypothetical protein
VRQTVFTPSRTAPLGESPVAFASGVKRKSGTAKIKSQSAAMGPAMRLFSWALVSRPKSGTSGMKPQGTAPGSIKAISIKIRMIRELRLPSARPRPDSPASFFCGAICGSIEL